MNVASNFPAHSQEKSITATLLSKNPKGSVSLRIKQTRLLLVLLEQLMFCFRCVHVTSSQSPVTKLFQLEFSLFSPLLVVQYDKKILRLGLSFSPLNFL
jgi:hypothetical protein